MAGQRTYGVTVLKLTMIITLFGYSSSKTYRTILTPSGPIKGINVQVSSQNLVQFRNIPYAKPPTGNLRLRKPVPVDPWTETLDATEFGPFCIQPLEYLPSVKEFLPNSNISEDCLQLNVFVPDEILTETKKSVMIWIHGGGFVMGSGSIFDGSYLARFGDVIVVTINYRLGPLGFLSTEDSASPGNYGLWDQIMAFKWVKNNIAAFGGNPESITIFGNSAGSISVSLHMLIPENRGLFHRAISQSGVASSTVAFNHKSSETAKTYGKMVKCINDETSDVNTFALIDCLRTLSADEILQGEKMLMSSVNSGEKYSLIPTFPFPVVDGELFPKYPIHFLRDEESHVYSFFKSIDYMAGTTNFEGGIYANMLIGQGLQFNISEGLPTSLLCDWLGPIVGRDIYNDKNITANVVCDYYKHDDNEEQARRIMQLIGDVVFYASTIKMLDYHSQKNIKSNTFQYVFSKATDSDFITKMPRWGKGQAPHGEELLFLFGPDFMSKKYDVFGSETSTKLLYRIVKYWTNFAKTGDPNGDPLPKWTQYRDTEKSYIDLDDAVTQQKDLFKGRMQLHLKVIPDKIQQNTKVITTPLGKVKGINIPIESKNVLQFRNIPYAKAPVGNLRFRKPVAFGEWENTLDATSFGPACIQNEALVNLLNIGVPSEYTSEDCLNLNIYVPFTVDLSLKRSVMVWIHGGCFAIGQGQTYDGSWLALGGEVIVVTINYRLGVFGFMTTEDDASPGNYGLWDQIMALKWVQTNIADFGGDPDSVTIFGESAGSFSVTLQMLIPENRGLFHRTIAQSGAATSHITFQHDQLQVTKELAEILNCSTDTNSFTVDTFSLAECLRHTPLQQIREAQTTVFNSPKNGKKIPYLDTRYYHFWPVIDSDLFKGRNPIKCLSDIHSGVFSFFHSVDLMAGITDFEGQFYAPLLGHLQNEYNFSISEGVPTSVLLEIIAPAVGENAFNCKNIAANVLYSFYQRDDNVEQGKQICDLLGSIVFIAPTVQLLDLHTIQNTHSSTYQYVFTKALDGDVLQQVPSWTKEKSGHFQDVFFLFGPEILPNIYNSHQNEASKRLSYQMIQYWTNFAKTGNPEGKDLPKWPSYKKSERAYIDLNDIITEGNNVFKKTMTLFQSTIPSQIEKFTVLLNTPSGPLKGIIVPVKSQKVLQFRNIPYGKPPIKKLRFRKTVPFGKWTKTLDATAFGPSCIQDTTFLFKLTGKFEISEDCLSLNVYVPGKISRTTKKSVMVWFHGGGFNAGQGSFYDGSWLALEGDVIVVTLNYRLGALGFLSTGDASAPGNYGLWDQRTALQWVKYNIEAFGGDSESITIFGESAGSFSVTYQMMIPENKGLFHRAIAASGAANLHLTPLKEPLDMTKSVGKDVKCIKNVEDDISTLDLIECIRNVDAHTIIQVQNMYTYIVFSGLLSRSTFFPMLEGDLYPHGNPVPLLSDPNSVVASFYKSVDFIGGQNNLDGSLGLMIVMGAMQSMNLTFDISEGIPTSFLCDLFIPNMADGYFVEDKTIVEKALCDFYSRQDLQEQGKQLLNMYGDIVFVAPMVKAVNFHTNDNTLSNTYQYLFSRGSGVPFLVPIYNWTTGAGHGEDTFYIFGPEGVQNLVDVENSPDMAQLSKTMLRYWTNFAKTGDPNGDGLPQWPRYDRSKQEFLNLDSEIEQGRKLYEDRMKLFFETIPDLDRKSKLNKDRSEL